MDFLTYEKINDGTEENQQEKPPIPPAIEDIAGKNQEKVLYGDLFFENKPIQTKYQGEEKQKFYGIK